MSPKEHRSEWSAIIGIALVVLGLWLIVERFFSSLVEPIRALVETLGRIGWPIAIIALGVLLLVASRSAPSGRRLTRSRDDRMVSGVLGGVAEYLRWQSTLVRVLFVVLVIVTGFGPALLLYILAVILIPEAPVSAETPPPPAPPAPPSPPAPPAPPVPPRP